MISSAIFYFLCGFFFFLHLFATFQHFYRQTIFSTFTKQFYRRSHFLLQNQNVFTDRQSFSADAKSFHRHTNLLLQAPNFLTNRQDLSNRFNFTVDKCGFASHLITSGGFFSAGFGITTTFWDHPFNTVIPDEKF